MIGISNAIMGMMEVAFLFFSFFSIFKNFIQNETLSLVIKLTQHIQINI